MQIVLLERVEKLGFMGDVVEVKPGHARNHLFPKGKALRATKENLAYFESRKAQLEADNLTQKSEAEKAAARIEGQNAVMIRQAGDSGQLYGSVTPRDIAEAFTKEGFTLTRHQVSIAAPIKNLGVYVAKVRLHPEVTVDVTVNVAKSDEEAISQMNEYKGVDTSNKEKGSEEKVEGSEA